MRLWYLSYVHSRTNRFAGSVICDGGERNDDDGLIAAAQTAFDRGISPGKGGPVDEQYQVTGAPVPDEQVARMSAHRDKLLSLAELRVAFPEYDWKRLADHEGRN